MVVVCIEGYGLGSAFACLLFASLARRPLEVDLLTGCGLFVVGSVWGLWVFVVDASTCHHWSFDGSQVASC